MKKKFLIGGGITALIAAIVVIVVLAQGGNYFQGSTFGEIDTDFSDIVGDYPDISFSDGPNLYVSNTITSKTCDENNPIGSKKCPFKTIQRALNRMHEVGGNNFNIYVSEGTYADVSIAGYTYKLLGGYDDTFQNKVNNTLVNRRWNFSNMGGEISGFKFQSPALNHGFFKVDNEGSNKSVDIHDNTFTGGFTAGDFITLIGDGVTFRNNHIVAKSRQNVVYAENKAKVENNSFYRSVSGAGAPGYIFGIIGTNSAYAFNNLITNCLSGTEHAIVALGKSTVSNNTISNNSGIVKFAINLAGEAKAYNNLIARTGGEALAVGEFASAKNNGINETEVKIGYLENGNVLCDPDFTNPGSSTKEAYKLGEETTCANNGETVYLVSEDAFGTSRPQGSAYDIGFYEIPFEFIPNLKFPDKNYYIPTEDAVCGNGTVEEGEECDDGNTEDGDGCDSNCKIEEEEEETDVCENIEGIQTTVPSGYELVGNDCLPEEEDPDPGQTEEVECGDWTDVSSSDQEYDIWMYLCNREIVKGNSDGTLRPDDKLNRAELLALAFRASDYENIYNIDSSADYCFPDVKNDWFAKYFCTAKNKGFIEGYQDGYAKPERDVILAEGLKIFLGALDEPFDVSDSDCWYCDMVDEAGDDNYIPYSFSDPTQVGPLDLTRRKAFNMLYRIMIYK
ncbi:hypothetical protein GF369_04875 [Candidatus Peregrinibacteria bacterium]|nr:hypothetical protein [Candidatus Peregrinibacteria bacterium]